MSNRLVMAAAAAVVAVFAGLLPPLAETIDMNWETAKCPIDAVIVLDHSSSITSFKVGVGPISACIDIFCFGLQQRTQQCKLVVMLI